MAFYNEKEQLYQEKDALSVSVSASFLQVRDRMWFPKDEVLINTALWQTAFSSKSKSSTDSWYSKI